MIRGRLGGMRPVACALLVWGFLGCGGGAPERDLRSPEILLADRMWSRGGIEDARAALAEAAEIPATRFAALYRLGLLWLADDPQLALGYLADAALEYPEHPGPVFLSGVARNALNEFREADLEMKKGYEMARRRLGVALPDTGTAAAEGFQALGRREYAAAAAAFARARDAQGDLAQLRLLEATALERVRNLEGAREAVDRALELDPGFVEARVARARLTNIAGDAGAARLELDAVLAEHPNLASAHFNLGILQLADSDFRDAALSFWWALLDDPTRPEAHSAAATVLSRMDLSRAAMPSYRMVEAINAFLGRYYGRLGFSLRQ